MQVQIKNQKSFILTFFFVINNSHIFSQVITDPNVFYSNSKTIDASESDDFHQGFSILRKGENFALMFLQGDIVIPYGKYKFNKKQEFEIDKERCGFHNGMCAVRDPDSEMYGFIDSTTRLVVPCMLLDVSQFQADGFAWAKQKDAQGREEQVYIDKKGNKYKIKNQSLYNHNNLQAYAVPTVNNYTAFYSKNGTYLFKTKRHYKDGFSEGLIRWIPLLK